MLAGHVAALDPEQHAAGPVSGGAGPSFAIYELVSSTVVRDTVAQGGATQGRLPG